MAFGSDDRVGVCVGVDGGAMCVRWCWQHWRDGGLRVLALALMEVGGVRVGAIELRGILVGGDGLALPLLFVLASRGDGGERHWRWRQ